MGTARRAALAAIAAACMGSAGIAPAADEDTYPNRPVKIVVPFTPAGSTDIMARRLAERLTTVLGQSFVVENRPGAGGNIGAAAAAKSPADGYTLLVGSSGVISVNPHLYKDAGFDASKDFATVSLLVKMPTLIVAHPDFPARDLSAFLDYVKANPLGYGHPSTGSSKHVAAEDFRMKTGARLSAIAYKGSAPMLNDLIGGHIKIAFDEPLTSMPHIRGGRIVPVAITGSVRWPTLPDVPRISELGGPLADYEVTGWFGLFVPTGTHPKIVERLNAAVRKVFADEEFRKMLYSTGSEPVGSTAADGEKFVRQEYRRWGELIKATNLKAD